MSSVSTPPSSVNIDVSTPSAIAGIHSVEVIDDILERHKRGEIELSKYERSKLSIRRQDLDKAARQASQPPLPPPPVPPPRASRPPRQTRRHTPPPPPPPPPASTVDADAEKIEAQKRFAKCVKPMKLSPSAAYAWMIMLAWAAGDRVSMTTKSLGELMNRSQQSASQALKELEAAGLLVTLRHGRPATDTQPGTRSDYVIRFPSPPPPQQGTTP